jgi:outer membrane putative beta-barrel porin/alpha-amylase
MRRTRAMRGGRSIRGRRAGSLSIAILIALAGAAAPARAHEPLWGETPTIFGPGVFHPEIRLGFMRAGSASRPGGESERSFGQEYGLQYGVNRWVNVRATVPVADTEVERNLAGAPERTTVSGVGDILLDAKIRFRPVQEIGMQRSHALIVGWKLPTGADDALAADGTRLSPGTQAGTGRHGYELGYAFDREKLRDTFWTSAMLHGEIGDDFRLGDHLEVDAAYGVWARRPNTAEDLGVNLAFGVHGESAGSDHLEGGVSAGNAHRFAGVLISPIVTKGRYQFRVGLLVPLIKRGDEDANDFGYEVRAGWEAFF